jgi:cobalt-zinc-cadmium efflux system membrane fusion protein
MKTRRNLSLLLAALLALSPVAACRKTGGERGQEEEHAGEESHAPGEPHEEAGHEDGHEDDHEDDHEEAAEDGQVRIAPEMLRDLKLTTAQAEAREAQEGVSVLGELTVNENAYAAVATPIPARVAVLRAEPGQGVRAGQVLAELQSVEVGRARADYESAAARAELAGQTLERKRGLAAERIVSQGELQEATATAAGAAAELRAARAGLAALGVPPGPVGAGDPSRFPLTSPIAGTVIERAARRGETADPAAPLFRIADLSRLWLVVHAFERDAVSIARGSAVEVSFAALPGRSFRGKVARVGEEVATDSRTVPVRIDLVNEGGLLRPGMSATALLPLESSTGTVVTVPAAALQRIEESWSVFIPRGERAFEVRPVGRGRDLGGEVEILSGLTAGTIVVVDGAFLLKAEADKAHGGGEHHHH